MSRSEVNRLALQKRVRTERACEKALDRMRWPEGYAGRNAAFGKVHKGVAKEIESGQAIHTDGLSVYDQLTTFDHAYNGSPVPPRQAAKALR